MRTRPGEAGAPDGCDDVNDDDGGDAEGAWIAAVTGDGAAGAAGEGVTPVARGRCVAPTEEAESAPPGRAPRLRAPRANPNKGRTRAMPRGQKSPPPDPPASVAWAC